MLCSVKTLWLGICVFFFFTISNAIAELKFVNLLWRHGARSPIHYFPKDIHKKDKTWPQGSGQLTQNGMKQHYELGVFLRQRYGKLLSSQYNRSEIYVRSTDFDRTLQSAQCNLAGLYNLTGIQMWNGSHFTWQPIPVHTESKDNDHLLLFHPNEKYSKLMKKVWKSSFVAKIEREHKKFFQEILKLSGLKNTSDLDVAGRLHDSLVCEKAQNLSWPDWVASRWKTLVKLAEVNLGLSEGAGTPYRIPIGKLRGGVVLKQILVNMRKNINQSDPYKVIAYSAHDTTLSSVLSVTNVFDHVNFPTFASCFMFELHENVTSSGTEYFVKTFYRKPATNLFHQLNIYGCGMDCPLSELEKKVVDISEPNSSDIFDQMKKRLEVVTTAFYVIFILLVFTFLVMILKTIVRCRSSNSGWRDSTYQPLASHGEEA